jgi:arylsulfatase A-like enzyme
VNVVLVVCDTLRADHVGVDRGPVALSPWIDRLAAEGVRFRNALSPHIPTQPAHTSLFSGTDVFTHRVVAHGGAVEPPAGLTWLPELLQGAGCFTAAADNIGRWMPRGFAVYESYALAPSPDGYWRKADATLGAVGRLLPAVRAAAAAGRDTFMFIHFWDPHTPYCPPPPFHRMFYDGDERRPGEHGLDAMWAFAPFTDYFRGWMPGVTDRAFPRAQYAACVRALDHGVQRLCTLLAGAGLLQDSLVLLTADHGEELGEHGIWFDHHGLYETNLRVPLILWGPGRVPRGWTCGDRVTLLDVVPTVLGALGLPVPADLPGRDLAAAWGDGLAPLPPLYCTECTWMKKRAWRTDRYKLISALEPDFHGGPDLELYDLEVDPGETANLAEVQPGLAQELLDALESHVARRIRATGRPDPLREQAVSSRRIGAPAAPVAEVETAGAAARALGEAIAIGGEGGAGTPPTPGDGGAPPAVSAEERERVSRRLANLGY